MPEPLQIMCLKIESPAQHLYTISVDIFKLLSETAVVPEMRLFAAQLLFYSRPNNTGLALPCKGSIEWKARCLISPKLA